MPFAKAPSYRKLAATRAAASRWSSASRRADTSAVAKPRQASMIAGKELPRRKRAALRAFATWGCAAPSFQKQAYYRNRSSIKWLTVVQRDNASPVATSRA